MAKLRIGFTQAAFDRSYVPQLDGWRAEADDEGWVFSVPAHIDSGNLEEMAEAFFEASNAPFLDYETGEKVYSSNPRVAWFQNYLYGGTAGSFRSMSVGDTASYVRYRADGSEAVYGLVECASVGWKRHL